MILSNAIYSVLIAIVITGIIPVIAGIVLLATGKIKGSSFWAGVLTFIIASIASLIPSLFFIPQSADVESLTNASPVQTLILSAIESVIICLSLFILIRNCMKIHTFKTAISAGFGFAVSQLLSIAANFITVYSFFMLINSGNYNKFFEGAVRTGIITKEYVAEAKSVYLNFTFDQALSQLFSAIGSALIIIAIAIIIMLYVIRKKALIGTLISIGGLILINVIAILIPNVLAAGIVVAGCGIAAFYAAYSMKNKIVAPEAPSISNDTFLQSIENAKNND